MSAAAPENLLDSVLLSERAVARWMDAARALLAERQLDPASVSNEDAEVLPGGELRLFCTDTAGVLLTEITIPTSEWTWAPRGLN
jgi:hypothetical protein